MSLPEPSERFVDVAVFAPLRGSFTYAWPGTLGEPQPGIRVRVPFGNGHRNGLVLSEAQPPAGDVDCKPVADRLDLLPAVEDARLQWLERAARYYLAAPGEIAELAFAWASNDGKRRFKPVDTEALAASDPELAGAFTTKRALSLTTIARHVGSEQIQYRVLQAAGRGELEEVSSAATELPQASKEPIPETLLEKQQAAVDAVLAASGSFKPFLLFGATGSGKTEVYLRVAQSLVGDKKQILILVPEIGLTPMWLARIAARFDNCAVWHSAMSDPERLSVRSRLADVDILIGTRSALFLPLPRLGLIVVDEEHDGSFKQQDGVAYSARDMALLLGQSLALPVLLGSATPSLESWRQCGEGTMQRLDLPERIGVHKQVATEIVDMRGGEEVLSEQLVSALKKTREAGEQAILFLNRRGYAPALQCTACGDVPECPGCAIRLTLHRRKGELRCHMCGYARRVPRICGECGEDAYMPLGTGTERLEDMLAEQIPELRFARFDRDTVTSQKRLTEVLSAFGSGELDCLIGTQMLVKGHHFPRVTLVGVINADLGMNLPDFRAGERWWQQMTQVVGRAGRGDIAGRVVIQTWDPKAAWLHRIGDQFAQPVLDDEMQLRRELSFPPFGRWVRLVFSATNQAKALQAANDFAAQLPQLEGVMASSPMPCAIERLAGRFRYELLLRDASRKILPWKLEPLLARMRVPSGVRRKVDVDPQDLM